MGKKASFKHDLSWEDEDWEDDYDDDDEFCHDDTGDADDYGCALGSAAEVSPRKSVRSGSTEGKKHTAEAIIRKKKPISSKTDMKVRLLAPPTKFLYFISDPRVTLSILDDDTLLHLSAYLPLRSIGALSCGNTCLDSLLSADFLYCTGTDRDSAFPSVQKLQNILTLRTENGKEARPRGLARTFAIESDVYSCPCGVGDESSSSRARNFQVADHIRSREVIDSALVHDGAVTYTTKSCEIVTRWCGSKATRSLTLPTCAHLVSSAYHKSTRVCAVLASHSKGRCRYVLTLVALPRQRDETPTVLWKHEFTTTLFSSSITRPIVKFNLDGSRILFGSLERCFAIDASGKNPWAMRRANLCSVIIQDKFVFALHNSSLNIYDVTQGPNPVASGTLPRRPNAQLSLQDIVFFGGRVWIVCETVLMCTARLMRVLRAVEHSGQEVMKVTVTDVSVLEPQIHASCCHDNFLYIASGKRIRRFDRRSVSVPCTIFHAEECVEGMYIDRTKIICTTAHPNGRSGRVEIIPICQFEGRAFPSVFVKRTFLSSHRMDSIQVDGRLLAVSYQYEVVEDRSYSDML